MTNPLPQSLIIAVDFDGTCVTHEFPAVGKDVPGAVKVLKRLVEADHKLILYTMRSNCVNNTGASHEFPEVINGNFLDDAVNWFKERDIELWGINYNRDQHKWTKSPKVYAQIYIDDAALGTPIIKNELSVRPYVDWRVVEALLELSGVLAVGNDHHERLIAYAQEEGNFFPPENFVKC